MFWSLDVGTSNVIPVEYFVILEMIGEKLFRYRIDGDVFILNYMKKITKKGNVSFLKMKFDRPSQDRLEFDLRDPENANLRRYYILYPLHPNLYDTNRSHISKGLIQLLKHNNDRLYWQEFSVLPCGSIIYIMKMHKPVTPLWSKTEMECLFCFRFHFDHRRFLRRNSFLLFPLSTLQRTCFKKLTRENGFSFFKLNYLILLFWVEISVTVRLYETSWNSLSKFWRSHIVNWTTRVGFNA